MFSVTRSATAAGLAILLGFLIFHAASRGIADLYGRHVRAELARWHKDRQPVPPKAWRAALSSAEAENRLTPGNPDSAESLGRLYDWAAFGKPPRHPLVLAYREQALLYFREAVGLRPVSGYTWANVAQAKLALDGPDGEFRKALELAALLAPWEPEVQLSVTDAGLAAWGSLDERSRKIVRDTVARALRRHAKDVFRLAQERSRTAVVCPLAKADTRSMLCK